MDSHNGMERYRTGAWILNAIWLLLREQRISLARKRSWCICTDFEFVAKTADVVGLYLSDSEKALVICVDEK